jgi:hypothetical protein
MVLLYEVDVFLLSGMPEGYTMLGNVKPSGAFNVCLIPLLRLVVIDEFIVLKDDIILSYILSYRNI